MRTRVRFWLFLAVAWSVLLGGWLLSCAPLERFLLTGQFHETRIIETLRDPIPVAGWRIEGLIAADGRLIRLPGVDSLPLESAALREATARAVEIASEGRVFGLVRVHHWCGNDPVGEHLARVDISLLLRFIDEARLWRTGWDAGFGAHGWNVSRYFDFLQWQKYGAVGTMVPGSRG